MEIKKIAVIGSGTMGSAIAEVFAFNGYEVIIRDVEQRFIDNGMKKINEMVDSYVKYSGSLARKEHDKLAKAGIVLNDNQSTALDNAYRATFTVADKENVMKRIHPTINLNDIEDADLVVEAIPEKMELKKEIFTGIDKITRKDAIIASNTSSLSITELAAHVSKPDKVIITHFFNPPYLLPLVEVVSAMQTSQETEKIVFDLISKMKNHRTKMVPVKVKESPGFLVNRLLIPMVNEAIFALDENVAEAKDIDIAMKNGAGMPMGPLELADMIGLDIVLDVMDVLYNEYKDPKYRASPLLKKMVKAGWIGKKSGRGFFVYK